MNTGIHFQMQVFLYEEDQWRGSVRTPKFDHVVNYYNTLAIINWHNWYI